MPKAESHRCYYSTKSDYGPWSLLAVVPASGAGVLSCLRDESGREGFVDYFLVQPYDATGFPSWRSPVASGYASHGDGKPANLRAIDAGHAIDLAWDPVAEA